MQSLFVKNGSVYIHVLDNGLTAASLPPLLVIGGLWEPAERAIPLLDGLQNRVVALSLRGRGLSSTPPSGYDLSDHLSDIEAVVRAQGLKQYCVLGFSRGASYAIGWTLLHQCDMTGLILVDQPPVHQRPGSKYVEYWSNLVYLNIPILNFMRREALEGLARDAVEVDFSDQLHTINVPVVVFAGRNRNALIPSDMLDDTIEKYRRTISNCQVVEFSHSGHMIPDEEQDKYVKEVGTFLANRYKLKVNE